MKKSQYITVFVIMVIVQLGVPASMIFQREVTLQQGQVYRFRCEAVDPYDAFRGKYVRLNVITSNDVTWHGRPLQRNQKVYVLLAVDEEGFAKGSALSLTQPSSGDYIEAKVRWQTSGVKEIPLLYPFDRYYMEESIAPEAERVYRQAARDEAQPAYISVRVRNGFGVIEELYIEDTPILEYLTQQKDEGK